MDPRASQLVDLVLDYSIDLKKGDKLIIQCDPFYKEYVDLITEKASAIGAEVKYDSISHDPNALRGFIERYDMTEWDEELQRRISLAKWCTARILLTCDSNPDYASGIKDSTKRVSEFEKKVIGPYKDVLYRKGDGKSYFVKWNIVGFPYEQGAKEANMTLEEYSDFVYDAALKPDWRKMSEEMEQVKKIFDNAKDVHIYVEGLTDLHLSLDGRGGEICDGTMNMPDGEVFYGPVEDSANGYIYFQHPTKRSGHGIVKGIRLEFLDGKVVNYNAKEGYESLNELINVDPGAKSVGELGIGFNKGIQKAILETLFDEKIAHTIHLALGNSFRTQPLMEGGGLNKSDIHWDLVCDLRKLENDLENFPGGWIKVDGKKVQENGEWLI